MTSEGTTTALVRHFLLMCKIYRVPGCRTRCLLLFAGAVSGGERGSRQGSPRRHPSIPEAHRAHGDSLHQNVSKSLQRDLLPQQAVGEHCLTLMPSVDQYCMAFCW